MRRLLVTALVALGTLSASAGAEAYCRERTCDPADPKQSCDTDVSGCVLTGAPLFWSSSCVSFDVQAGGSPKSGIDADQATETASRAFAAWLKTDCGGAPPSIRVGTFGPVTCDESRYNETGRNVNVVIFHDDEWPYMGAIDSFGFTRVRFNATTGEIYDADVEINSADFDLSLSGAADGADLESILTHEFGHFLGMAHAGPSDPDATMRAGWNGTGTDLRTLTHDDEEGICAIYPPGRSAATSCEPRHGFASDCFVPLTEPSSVSCASMARRNGTAPGVASVVGSLLLLSWRRRAMRRRAVNRDARRPAT